MKYHNHMKLITIFRDTKSRLVLLARHSIYAIIVSFFIAGALHAETLIPPDDPSQSITYWKPHTLSAEQDPLVAQAQSVFSVLLRAWDSSRLEPSLYVVDSSAGPWAASLADGNILLSRSAIESCLSFGEHRAEHLLAFILAHELAHQRSDDLWHQRFFRVIDKQSPETKQKLLHGLQLNQELFADLEQTEAQADHDGLIMMGSVGFDPYQILDQKDFFTAWVENIWQNSCTLLSEDAAAAEACKQAQARALRTKAQLGTVATQAMLYELGVQAFIANQFSEARRYFTAYGRDYPSRAVLSALGLTHLAQALKLQQQLIQSGSLDRPDFYYPLLLDMKAEATPVNPNINTKRAALSNAAQRNLQQMRLHLQNAIDYFEKAIRLEPNHEKSYILLAMTYLVDGNTFMARGVIQGKYLPKFGKDVAVDILLAMTSSLENNNAKAEKEFDVIIDELSFSSKSHVFSSELLLYTSYRNSTSLAKHMHKEDKVLALWKQFANLAKSHGNGFLFRLAVAHINTSDSSGQTLTSAPNISGKRLGDILKVNKNKNTFNQSELWLEGEQYLVYRFYDGSRFVVNANKNIINAWQGPGKQRLAKGVALGDNADRPLKSFGIPNRRMHLMSGEYLAYDDYGLAVHIDNNKVVGWFLY